MGESLELRLGHEDKRRGLHYWLLADGLAVSYLKLNTYSDDQETILSLCDIETRPGHRRRGYATELLKRVAQAHGQEQVSHGGSYTAEGLAYIAHRVRRIGAPATEARYGPLSFVESWEDLRPRLNQEAYGTGSTYS